MSFAESLYNSKYPFEFRTPTGLGRFKAKYALSKHETWPQRAAMIVNDVCGDRSLTPHPKQHPLMSDEDQRYLFECIASMKFIPGGRYIYYAGREVSFFNNCFVFIAEEDTREEWARLMGTAGSALMSGGGIGVDYSVLRPSGSLLRRTGGVASGPVPLMRTLNEIGRNVMQGGSRRSALYASLNWQHPDVESFIHEKEWTDQIKMLKANDFNFPAPMDMTNMSLNYDDRFLDAIHEEWDYGQDGRISVSGDTKPVLPSTFVSNCYHAVSAGEPGFSFNFGKQENETGRNACTEFISDVDSDVCNLGSVNLSRIDSVDELRDVARVASMFLVNGSIRSQLPTRKCQVVREEERKIGLGLMGVHEWLLQRDSKYTVSDELHEWLGVYRDESESAANAHADRFFVSRPKRYRAVAPAGTIGILAGTSTGIEPVFASAYKRRYIDNGDVWKHEYVVEPIALEMYDRYGVHPDELEDSFVLSSDVERRLKFQYDIQKYVDMGISSTINLPEWNSSGNNPDTVDGFAQMVAKYAHGLRGLTFYPQGGRMGQPLTRVPYDEAMAQKNIVFTENEEICAGGICGL